MGTKVQYKSYFQGYSPMRDLNDDAGTGNWPLYYGDQMLKNRQCYNGFLPRPTTDGHSNYDKEMLKNTMLEHEDIFRNQVFELHRLYRKQKDLMEELKRKEVQKYPVAMEASQSKYLSPQMPFEHVQNTSHLSGAPFVNSAYSGPSVSCTDNRQSPLKFVKESSMQVDSVPSQNGRFGDCKYSESNSAKLPKRMFDLQLPADEYIDSEEGERIEDKGSQGSVVASYACEKNSGGVPETDVNLSLTSGRNLKHLGDASGSDPYLWTKGSLADLNQPIQVEEAPFLAPINNLLGPFTCNSRIQGQNPGSFSREFFHRSHTDNRPDANVLQSDNAGSRREWQSYSFEAGPSRSKLNSFPQGFGPEEFRTTSRPFQAEFNSTQLPTFLLGDKTRREPWNGSAVCGAEYPKSSPSVSNHSFSRPIELPLIQSPYSVIPDVTESMSSVYSSWRKQTSTLSQNQIAVQPLPCFNNSTQANGSYRMPLQNPGPIEAYWHLNHLNLPGLNSSFGSQGSYRNGTCSVPQLESSTPKGCLPSAVFDYPHFRNGCSSTSEHFENGCSTKYFKGSNCRDVKSAKDINLNLAIPNSLVEGKLPQQDLVIIDGEGKNEDVVRGLPWLRTTSISNNGPTNRREGSAEVGFDLMKPYSLKPDEKENVPSSSFIQDTASTSCALMAEDQRIHMNECSSSKRILGFPIFDKPHISLDGSSHSFDSEPHRKLYEVEATHNNRKVGVLDLNLSRSFDKSHVSTDEFSPNFFSQSHHRPSEVEATHNNGKVAVLDIDLPHDPALPDSLPKKTMENNAVAEESRIKNHFNLNSCADEEEPEACFSPGPKVNIDLEAPAVPENAEDTPLVEDSQCEKLEAPSQSSQIEVGDASEEVARLVAETIVNIASSGIHLRPDDVTCQPPETPLFDCLHWFAGVVSSNTNDLDRLEKDIYNCCGFDSDESDYFEMMTLRLTEAKVDEYWSRSWETEIHIEEEIVAPSVPTRRRRGHARRGRQRRDFQRDILPGLTSLSRHEVTADLQTIGGLMKATGQTWETALARRNGARNGWARGRRRGRNPATVVAATVICSPPVQQTDTIEPGLEESSLKGWGKTTRRPRRQRVAAGNNLQ